MTVARRILLGTLVTLLTSCGSGRSVEAACGAWQDLNAASSMDSPTAADDAAAAAERLWRAIPEPHVRDAGELRRVMVDRAAYVATNPAPLEEGQLTAEQRVGLEVSSAMQEPLAAIQQFADDTC